jgi:hypothetical protein
MATNSPAQALDEPFSGFPSWFPKLTCDRCGKDRFVNEVYGERWRDRALAEILRRMRHDGCGGLSRKAELLSGIAVEPARAADRAAHPH